LLLVTSLRGLIVLALVWSYASGAEHGRRAMVVEYSQIHMGLPVRIRLCSPEHASAAAAADAAFARIAALDRAMSDYRPDSELRGIAAAAGRPISVSADLLAVLERAVDVARRTDGAFDPTVGPLVSLWREARATGRLPDRSALEAAQSHVGWGKLELDITNRTVRLHDSRMQLDLGGIAKGYILQQAVRTLTARGATCALVEAGGDIVVGDPPPGRDGWQIDADGADAEFRQRASRLKGAALATSGPTAQFLEVDGVRYSHVVDPRSGIGVTNGLVAHVIADDAATADALATALTVVGSKDAPAVLERFPGVLASIHHP
jgi:thiamine biosynthesis lipoprotein